MCEVAYEKKDWDEADRKTQGLEKIQNSHSVDKHVNYDIFCKGLPTF